MSAALMITSLLLSGCAGLIYEVAWIRRGALVFGSTTFALSTVLAVFFLGLALGSYFFGRLSQKTRHPLRLFVLLELGLAAIALASPAAFELAEVAYGGAYRIASDRAPLLFALRVALVAIVLLPPTTLMGGTLPLFCRQFVTGRAAIARGVGGLYAVNTLGAAIGAVLAGSLLLPELGVRASIRVGAALNVLAALAVIGIRSHAAAEVSTEPSAAVPRPAKGLLMAALFFNGGFVALGLEVSWARFLALLIPNTIHTYTLTLAVTLIGLVVGSGIAALLSDRTPRLALWFGALQIGVALVVMTLISLPTALWRDLAADVRVYFLMLLPAAALSGACFPMIMRMAIPEAAAVGIGVGRLAAVNTLGGIAGSLLVGFWGLPLLGLKACFVALTGFSLAGGLAAWHWLDRVPSWRIAPSALVVFLWVLMPSAGVTRLPADFLLDPGEELLDYREGLASNLAVLREEEIVRLEIDRWWQGESRRNHQLVAAHLPMLIHPDPRRVLVVGLGVGQSLHRFLAYDIERLDVVEIEPALPELVREHFDARWMDDERVRLVHDDGRTFVSHAADRYDVISLELGQIFRPGVAAFYSQEFYTRARDRLRPGGLLSQFVPLPFLTSPVFRSAVATFLEVFPESQLWYNTAELILVGSLGRPPVVESTRLELLHSDAAIREDLAFSPWGGSEHWLNRPSNLMGGFLMGPAGLAALAGAAAPHRDDRPQLEYAASHVRPSDVHEIAIVELLRTHLEAIEGAGAPLLLDAGELASAARMRDLNLGDLVAAALLRRVDRQRASGDLEGVRQSLDAALAANPMNGTARRLRADALALGGAFESAEAAYRDALEIREDDALAHVGLAFTLHRLGRVGEALPHYRAGLARRRGDAEAHNNYGAALAQLGRLSSARVEFERALELRPGWAEAESNLRRVRRLLESGP